MSVSPNGYPYNNPEALAAIQNADKTFRDAAVKDTAENSSAYSKLHNSLTNGGKVPLTVTKLLKILNDDLKIKCTRSDVTEIFRQYDANVDEVFQLGEFARWWGNANDATSILLRNALSQSTLEPGMCDLWKRGNSVRAEVTVGKVDASSFNPQAGIYVTAVPATEKDLYEACGLPLTSKKPYGFARARVMCKKTATEDDISEIIDLANAAADMISGKLPGNEKIFDINFKRAVGNGWDNDGEEGNDGAAAAGNKQQQQQQKQSSDRSIEITFKLLSVPMRESDEMRKKAEEVLKIAGCKDAALFRSIVAGLEFDCDMAAVLEPLPREPLMKMLDKLRLHLGAELDDTWLRVGAAALLTAKGGEVGFSEHDLPPLFGAVLGGRAVRDAHFTAHFKAFDEVAEELTAMVLRMPFLPVAADDDKDKDSLCTLEKHVQSEGFEQGAKSASEPHDAKDGDFTKHKRAQTAALLMNRLQRMVMAPRLVRSTIVWALPIFRPFLGHVPPFYIIDVLHMEGSSASPSSQTQQNNFAADFARLLDAAPNSDGAFNEMTVSVRKAKGDMRYGLICDNAGIPMPNAIMRDPGDFCGGHMTVVFISCDSEANFALGVSDFTQKCQLTRDIVRGAMRPECVQVLFVNTGSAISSEKAQQRFTEATGVDGKRVVFGTFDGNRIPADITRWVERVENFELGQDSHMTADPDEIDKQRPNFRGKRSSGGEMDKEELALRLADTAMRVISGVSVVEATNEVANVEVRLKNLPLGDVFGDIMDLERIRRIRLEFELRMFYHIQAGLDTDLAPDRAGAMVGVPNMTKAMEQREAAQIKKDMQRELGLRGEYDDDE